MKLMRLLFIGMLLVFSQCIRASSSPLPMLEKSADHIISQLNEHRSELKSSSKDRLIQQAVQQHILPHVDTVGMSRSVLGSQVWSKASPQEREAFTKAFTQLVIRTHATPLTEYNDETIRFFPIKGSLDKRFVRVNSMIVRPHAKNIPLTYSLVNKNGDWKIYDLSVEGVSLLQSFRSQFADALRRSNMQEIIAQLNQQSNHRAG